jgi:hypothetical protein
MRPRQSALDVARGLPDDSVAITAWINSMGTLTVFDSMFIRFSNVRIPCVDTSPAPINTRAGIRKMIVIGFFISPPEPRG